MSRSSPRNRRTGTLGQHDSGWTVNALAPRRKYVNRHILKELCQAQLSNDEISRVLRVSWDTLDRRYAEAIKAWRTLGPASVRRELFLTAMGDSKGKLGAMIFYLKNYGGMADVARNSEPSKPLDYGNLPIPASQSGTTRKPN